MLVATPEPVLCLPCPEPELPDFLLGLPAPSPQPLPPSPVIPLRYFATGIPIPNPCPARHKHQVAYGLEATICKAKVNGKL
ncbi:hypothetical protein EX30DRAFT_342986 [Ascodesmis nigricans]|uniref:Uncharacterized protein n=1 Tax=Ascodesmis nigricans TaxID=341454 RepID=A0A4S2MNH5_9PEZI|nr:hypothetical protein EX30DRAFT_342986 [Ascodesmis nigricans]